MSAIAPMRTSQTSTSAPELPGERREYPPLIVPSTPSPRHRPPALRSLGEGRRRRDGATGTTGTGLLLVTTARNITPEIGARRIGCRLPGAHRCARSQPARGSAKLLTARTSARPDFPFSRLISRLDCAQLHTGSAVRGEAGSRFACPQWARSWHVEEAAKERTAGIVARTIDTSSSRPGASVSRFHARIVTHFRPSPEGEAGHLDAQRCARSGPTRSQVGVDRAHQQRAVEQVRKPARASEVRTINAQIGVQPATINMPLDVQIGSQKEGLEGGEGGRQDKRIVSVVSVFAADSGTCSADVVAEGHTNIRRQGKRNQGALFVSLCPAITWRNL